jgi:hypothetical protein
MMRNLYEETMAVLKEHGKTFDDIVGICGDDFQISKNCFLELSNTLYDEDYGAAEVATDLRLVGADFWLERGEYDGREWWDYKTMPNLNNLPCKDITALTVRQSVKRRVGWKSLSELNVTCKEDDYV